MTPTMTKVVCCVCDVALYLKPGNDEISHSFCPKCLAKYCEENGIKPLEIFVPDDAIVNHKIFPNH